MALRSVGVTKKIGPFVLAWAAIRNGVYQREEDWPGGTCLAAPKWWAWAFVPVAAVGLVIGP
jgi:hypothetical protein